MWIRVPCLSNGTATFDRLRATERKKDAKQTAASKLPSPPGYRSRRIPLCYRDMPPDVIAMYRSGFMEEVTPPVADSANGAGKPLDGLFT